jgi:hypothetical protein
MLRIIFRARIIQIFGSLKYNIHTDVNKSELMAERKDGAAICPKCVKPTIKGVEATVEHVWVLFVCLSRISYFFLMQFDLASRPGRDPTESDGTRKTCYQIKH